MDTNIHKKRFDATELHIPQSKLSLLAKLSPKSAFFVETPTSLVDELKQIISDLHCITKEDTMMQCDLVYIYSHRHSDCVGDNLFSLLEKFIRKATYLFIDKSFLIDEIDLCVLYFLRKYREYFDYCINLPGGEVLISVKPSAQGLKSNIKGYQDVKDSYTTDYYLKDCGGYTTFNEYGGSQLDARLMSVFMLSDINPGELVLDVGCGRGELSYFIHKNSAATVVGMDYSEDAIRIAKESFSEAICEKLDFVQCDILKYSPPTKFDKVILSDVIEHIEQEPLERMFEKISFDLLSKEGVLIGHTAPNLHYYQYTYESKRREAQRLGLFIPKNPRSVYEDLMHINEQTEQNLQMVLEKYFKYACTWIPLPDEFFGTLRNKDSFFESTQVNDIYCIASNTAIDMDKLYMTFRQEKIEGLQNGDIVLATNITRLTSSPGQALKIDISIKNRGTATMKSFDPYPVCVSYHIDDVYGDMMISDGLRTHLPGVLYPGSEVVAACKIVAPNTPGEYIIRLTMVQEHCFWFEDLMKDIVVRVALKVV